jgi:hypothetical protein
MTAKGVVANVVDPADAMDVAGNKEQPQQGAVSAAVAPEPTAAAGGCQFFMSGKKRLCNWPCKPGQHYCGNHLFEATGGGEARVPCPANPNQ